MDAHLITKIIHMTAVTVALVVFVARAFTLFIGTQNQQPNPIARVPLTALQHLSYSIVLITGVVLLFMKLFSGSALVLCQDGSVFGTVVIAHESL